MLDKGKIFARKPKLEKVFIESLGDDVFIKEFIVKERNAMRNAGTTDFQLISLILGVCDEEGVPLFTVEDIPEMEKMPQILADELLLAVVSTNENKEKDIAKNS